MRNCILLLLISVYSFGQQYQKLPEIINTVPHNEYAPSISKDGSILVFQSDVSGIWRLYQTAKANQRDK
jgi:Tol biopolymer transport system component